jgi:hypothetical protein
MPSPSPTRDWSWLRPWPLLIAAVIAFVVGAQLLGSNDARQLAGSALIVVGAVCVGAWIVMLAAHDYPGYDQAHDVGPPGAVESAERADPPPEPPHPSEE